MILPTAKIVDTQNQCRNKIKMCNMGEKQGSMTGTKNTVLSNNKNQFLSTISN